MQLILSMEQQEYAVEAEPKQTISDVKQIVHEKFGFDVATQEILRDGKECPPTTVLESFGEKDVLRLTLRVGNKATQVVQQFEIERTIVVTDIPSGEQEETEDELIHKFSVYGDISRLILQRDSDKFQHAVVIYTTTAAANASREFDGVILGKNVTVISASQLPNDGRTNESNTGVEKVKRFLAKGVLLGQRGVDSLRDFDDRHHISLKIKAGADLARMKAKGLDEQYKLSEKVKLAGDKVHEFDTRHGISKTAASAVATATEKTKEVSEKAMQNENVAKGVQKINSIFTSLKTISSQSIDDVKNRVHQMHVDEDSRKQSNDSQSGPT